MTLSEPFIRRPVGTTLLALGLLILGVVAYTQLPVASLPAVDLPTIRVSATRPGADPQTMAATIAAPLERRLGEIAGVTEITSTSSLGSTNITVQFDLSRNVDGAARDVQAALNAAAADLPSDLPALPSFRKANPAAAPVLILALTSDTLTPATVFDVADSVIAQRIAQVPGVGEVSVSGADQPAVRVRLDPHQLSAMGTSLEAIRGVIAGANALGPAGAIDGPSGFYAIAVNDQLRRARDVGHLVVKAQDGGVVRLSSIASVEDGTRNSRSEATFNGRPSVLLIVSKQADANVIQTVDGIKALLPTLKRWTPAGLDVAILSDRTETIRASVYDMQLTLGVTALLVMGVVFVFLRRLVPTLAAGTTVPLSLAGTAALMWLVGFSIDNLSLMALAVAVGLVVDDAIVVIENIDRRRAAGEDPFTAAVLGARQIGFTVVAISLSLFAALIPLFFMGGTLGLFFREFSMTLAFAIGVSTVLALTLTPMLCARMRPPSRAPGRLGRSIETVIEGCIALYGRSLDGVLRRRGLALLALLATIAATVGLFIVTPKGFIPQDETGLLFGFTEASTDISFPAMSALQRQVTDAIRRDAAVAGVGSSVGGTSMFGGTVNQGRVYVTLKPPAERPPVGLVVARLRREVSRIPGISVFLVPVQDLRVGGRSSRSQYQLTLWGPDFDALTRAGPVVLERMKSIPGLVDVNSDREPNGLQAEVVVDRLTAARLGVSMADVGNALNNAFAQRQISTYYGPRNQYKVVLEVEPGASRDPADIARIHVPGTAGAEVPLDAVARIEKGLAPVSVSHQGPFPAITLSYNLVPQTTLSQAAERINAAVAELHLPDSIRVEAAGDAKAFIQASGSQGWLVLAAIAAVYIVLGVLYESLTQPLTILSTIPSAGLGALLALWVTGSELTLIALIGLVLLIGLVKKNGIMLVDFALECERHQGMTPAQAIREACLERFRPILMTTLAALLGALPLILAEGPGAELRRPLGITIVGGLLVSQMLTLYTTPAVYLAFAGLGHRLRSRHRAGAHPEAAGAAS